MKKFAVLTVIIIAVLVVSLPAVAGGKKCVGATPCLACKSCENCAYCKSGKKCGVCRNNEIPAAKSGLRQTFCDGVLVVGPKMSVMLPLPASDERVDTTFMLSGLMYRDEIAYDTSGGAMNERYRLKFADDHLISVEFDSLFTSYPTAEHYVDSVTKSLRSVIVSKDENMVAIGLGGHKTYYVPAIVCGGKAINHVFTLVPDLAGKVTILTHEVKMTPLPVNK